MVVPECNECHRDSDVPPNHVGGWNTEHARLASKEVSNCASCHGQEYCADCHYGGGVDAKLHAGNNRGPDYEPRSHRGNFLLLHPLSAADAPRSCEKCHPVRFCTDCHAKFRPDELAFASHRRGWEGGTPHTTLTGPCGSCHANSSILPGEWKAGHSREARRNLGLCQSCHEDGSTCVKCHSARDGLGVKPHPDNWDTIGKNLNRAAGKRTCVRCH